ncbi:MAG: hypothetical protein P8Q23_02375 [Paracoccaceae bacterium]|nr:hypothetical protein [Paracoccaceae bacterium]
MCSQFVSHVFNTCKDDRYHITYKDRPMLSEVPFDARSKVDTTALVDAIASASNTLFNEAQELVGDEIDILEKVLVDAFTPGDIKASVNTTLEGRLRKGLG